MEFGLHVNQHEFLVEILVSADRVRLLLLEFQLAVELVVEVDVKILFVYKFVHHFLVVQLLDLDLSLILRMNHQPKFKKKEKFQQSKIISFLNDQSEFSNFFF